MSILRQGAKLAFAASDLILPSPSGPRILIYHQVGAGLGRQMEVTTRDFEWQMNWLSEHRRVVSIEAAIQNWDTPDSSQLVVLTFDDGYDDTFRTAFPIMQEKGFPFTVYLATESIESGVVERGARPLSWGQIEEMEASGLATVGSHTHTHRDLRTVSEAEAVAELDTADRLIEDRLGLRPRDFAYPYGYWSEEIHPLVEARYETAVVGAPSVASSSSNPHIIHRFPVQLSDGRRWFAPRLKKGLRLEETIRRRLRGYRGP